MPLSEPQYKAIMNLGKIGTSVNEMNRQVIILKTQRIQTFVILKQLRELIQKLLNLYSTNKVTLDQVYTDIVTATTEAGETQQNLLKQLASELKKSLEDPTTEQQFTQLKADVEGLISRMNIATSSADPGPGPGADPGPGPGAGAGAAGDGGGSSSERSARESSSATDNFIRNINSQYSELLDGIDEDEKKPKGGKRRTKSGKRRTKRGGYSWRTPSPNKSRKKNPTYKKTIKKTRTRQN